MSDVLGHVIFLGLCSSVHPTDSIYDTGGWIAIYGHAGNIDVL